MKKILPVGCFLLLAWLAGALFPGAAFLAGHGPMPAISEAQADKFTTQELMAHGRGVLMAGFHSREEAGKENRRNGARDAPSLQAHSGPERQRLHFLP